MTDFKIEFEWEEDPSNDKDDKYPTEEQATAIYHEAEEAISRACHDQGVMLPTVAWMLKIEECEKCNHKANMGVIQ